MRNSFITRCLWATQALCAPLPAEGEVVFVGGTPDDADFARMAAALPVGGKVPEEDFQAALAAIRLTDRFRSVTGSQGPGTLARVLLDPWPRLAQLSWLDLPRPLRRGLRVGDRVGALKLEAWRVRTEELLRATGYPEARVRCERSQGDRALRVAVSPGTPARVERVEVAGRFGPYTRERLVRIARLGPLWTGQVRKDSLARVRHRLQKDRRLESRTELSWAAGTATLTVDAGPVVTLASEGDGLGSGISLKEQVALSRADRYGPELLDEGGRKLVRALRGHGYLEAQVQHRREVLRAGPEGPEEVRVIFTIRRGPRRGVRGIRFEGNRDLPESDLIKAAALPSAWLTPGGPRATPALMAAVAARVKAHYLSLGYAQARVRLEPLEFRDGGAELVYRVSEGPRKNLAWLRLELPPGGLGDPWGLGDSLAQVLGGGPRWEPAGPGRRYAGARGSGRLACQEGAAAMVFTFTPDQPIPFLKTDLAQVYKALKQGRLEALGVQRPVVRLTLEETPAGTGIQLVVPAQPMEQVRRVVVQGCDHTRARAVQRETDLRPGLPLDGGGLAQTQGRLANLGAFQRVELKSLADTPQAEPAGPWQPGDLLVKVEERPPYVVNSSFGYDASQGYHVGSGIQWLNVGGMGRTMDAGFRAGDGTINDETLRRWFPTGPFDRSTDAFSVGFMDPWFAPPALETWLPDRLRLSLEAGYVQERRSLYQLRRRRFTTSLEWAFTPRVQAQLGYRFERVEVGTPFKDINGDQLALLAHYPESVVISAPFAQLTRDTRDQPLDPTRGSLSMARVELANQLFLTSRNSSFVKLDLRQQWLWPIGEQAQAGVVALGLRAGLAQPTATSAKELPLSERFFAGGPMTQRGVQPDALGPTALIPLRDPASNRIVPGRFESTPVGGQGLAIINLEYRFPLWGKGIWGEVFVDSGQVYQSLNPENGTFPAFRTSLGLGVIFKLGFPLKIEYAADLKRILGQPRPPWEVESQSKGFLFSVGFLF